jgi:GT2 family glycosyltransferase/glycosyltransferase involved in cell wall biosynthesis
MAQRICIVTCDLVGPIRNGGIGTAFTAFAELMVECGNDVTILYPTDYSETQPLTYWMEQYQNKNICLESIFAGESGKELSFLVYHWLKDQKKFDVIHYHDWLGIGFWLASAKKQGLAFRDTTLVCQVHGQTIWHLEHSGEFLSEIRQLETDYLERLSVELADVIFSPSEYMIQWMLSRDWVMPQHKFVAPNLLLAALSNSPRERKQSSGPAPISEIVYFGRLETRKGLDLFCEAIDPIAKSPTQPFTVSFLGKIGQVNGRNAPEYIAEMAETWTVPYQILANYDVFAATQYLKGPGRLAVIASAIENSPYTVLECLAAEIPFLAADVGGIGELVSANDHRGTLFARDKKMLTARVRDALAHGMAPAKAAVDIAVNRENWKQWHAALSEFVPFRPAIRDSSPLVSVCMSTFNRPDLCALALNSIRRQTYPKIEVVLIDDASPSPEARQFIFDLAPEFRQRNWRLIQNEEELWTGKSRNIAVSHSTGDFVMLMDDDNIAKPHEVQTFITAALATHADILTCQQQPFAGMGEAPPFDAELPIGFLPIGANLPQALYENCLGDLNMMVRRQSWDQLGGFTDDRCGCEDVEFLARAVLAGYHLECLPEILVFYRISDGALANRYDDVALYKSFMRALRPFTSAVPKELALAVVLASTSRRHAERMAGHGYWGRTR